MKFFLGDDRWRSLDLSNLGGCVGNHAHSDRDDQICSDAHSPKQKMETELCRNQVQRLWDKYQSANARSSINSVILVDMCCSISAVE